MSTRYTDRDWEREDERYGRGEEDRGRYERGYYGARRDYTTGRDTEDYGYVGGAYGGGAYSAGSARDYGRGYGSREYGRDYSPSDYRDEKRPRYGRERDRERDSYGAPGRDFIERGYERNYEQARAREEEGGRDTDYGRTTSRFYGRGGDPYGRGYEREEYGRGAYGGELYGRRPRRDDDDDDDDRYERGYRSRGHGGRGWWDRAADEVRSWFGDEDAERRRRAEGAHGASHRGRGPRAYRRSDDRIREDINDRLTDNDWLDASDIEVSVVSAEVTLSGTVDSRYAKRLAEDIAESVSGVSHVQNNLRVNRGWEVGLGKPTVSTDALGTTRSPGTIGAGGLADTNEQTDATDATTIVRGSSRAAGQ